jgi:ABC-2 type transport system ATP-binding protein
MKAIQCEQVHKQFGNQTVLDNIDLQVEQGEFFGLVGMNGSGKSTMIKAILDLIAIDSGKISLYGKSHRRVHARDNIAYLPDRFSPPPHLRSKDFLNYMLELHGSKKSLAQTRELLSALELDDSILEMSVSKLSKGMTQKLGLASCLLSEKTLLILDEPMSGLDPKSRYLFKQQLADLRSENMTVFFSSHVLADVEELSDTMAVLHQHEILYTGTTDGFIEKYDGDNLEQAYMSSLQQG